MDGAALFIPETISDALRANLATGLRALADALDAQYDDRLYLRIVLDVAGPIVQTIAPAGSILKLDDQS